MSVTVQKIVNKLLSSLEIKTFIVEKYPKMGQNENTIYKGNSAIPDIVNTFGEKGLMSDVWLVMQLFV